MYPFTLMSMNYRTPLSMNYLLFAMKDIVSTGQYTFTSLWGRPDSVALENTDVTHLVVSINA